MHKLAIIGLAVVGAAHFASPAQAAFSCNATRNTTNSPYSQSKFTVVIEKSKLQLPDSSTCISNAQLKDYYYDADNWYVDNTNMVFAIDNGSTSGRNELRGNSFAANRTHMQWTGRLKMSFGSGYSTGFTVAQIYGETNGEPILRIEMIGSRNGVTNHLWGIYRTKVGSDAQFEYQDLGPAPTAFTDLILLHNSSGAVTAKLGANPTRTWTNNLSYWTSSSKITYFKAGCYLQDAGTCNVRFSTLRFDS